MLTQPILLIEDHHVVPLVNTNYSRRFINRIVMLTQLILLIEDHHVVPLVNTHYSRRFINSNADPADPPH
jgi:hypothetical protein